MDRNEKIWAYSSTGTKTHAFVQAWRDKDGKESTNHLRALCRGTIARHKESTFIAHPEVIGVCGACEKKAEEMYARAEASMEPATETHDLGYVAPVQEPADEADPAPEFPVGTRVATKYEGVGTVVDGDRGRVKNPNHPNYGLVYVTVLFYGRGTQPRHRSRVFVASLTNLDALHAEALETDAEETAKVTPAPVEPATPMRWRYTADLMSTDPGKPLTSRIGGYVTAPTRLRAVREIREAHSGGYLDDLILTPLN